MSPPIRERLHCWTWWSTPTVAAAIALSTLALYASVAGHEFLFYDDDKYVTANPHVLAGLTWSGARWAASSLEVANWHPLTWLSHMLDVELFGITSGAHHLVNAALHAANAALLFVVLARLTAAPRSSAIVAVLFAVHPLHVESVAWVSERKDLLSTAFGLLMLGAYAAYVRKRGAPRYALVLLCFAASLASKPMWVTAPFLLLLLDWWPLGRMQRAGRTTPGDRVHDSVVRLVMEKTPLLAMSVAVSAVAILAQQRSGALQSLERLDLGTRIATAASGYAQYLARTFWPLGLSAHYPQPANGPPSWLVASAAVLLIVVSALALRFRAVMPWLAGGWLWFLGTLVPVIGVVQVGSQATADRYTYVPIVGLFVALVWTAEHVASQARLRRILVASAALSIVVLSVLTWRQIATWRSQVTLFRSALAVTERNGRAHHMLSQALAVRGDYGEALVHAREAALLEPHNPRTHKNLGYVLYRMGLVDEAIAAFERAIEISPDYGEAHGNLAIAYGTKGRFDLAAREMALERELRRSAAQENR